MYKIRYTPHFKRTYRKLTKRDNKLKEITKVVIRKLVENPLILHWRHTKPAVLFLVKPGVLR